MAPSQTPTASQHSQELAPLRRRVAELDQQVTDLKSLAEELQVSERDYHGLVDNLMIGMYRMTPDGRIVMANQVLVQMLGYDSVDELLAKNHSTDYDPEFVRAEFLAHNGRIVDMESTWRRKDGSSIYVRENARAIYDDFGQPLYYDGIIEDITGRKQIEEAHNVSVKLLTTLLDTVEEGIIIVDSSCNIVKINQAVQHMWGYSPERLIGRNLEILIPELREIKSTDILTRYLAARAERSAEQRTEVAGLRKGGTTFPLGIEIKESRAGKRHLFIVAVRELAQANRGTALAAGVPHQAVVARNGDSALPITGMQRAAERLRGRAPEERTISHAGSPVGGPTQLLAYWKLIRKRLWLVIVFLLLGGALGGYYSYRQAPQYRATTTLFLNPAVASPLLPYQTYNTNTLQSLANTYSEFMRTRSFASRVVKEAGGALPEEEILATLSTQAVPDTQFFRISATYVDPRLAQTLANAAGRVLIAENIARQQAEQEQLDAQRNPDPETKHLADLRTELQKELDLYGDQIKNVEAQIADLQNGPRSAENDKRILDLQDRLLNLQSLRVSALNGLAQAQSTLTYNATPSSNVVTAVVVDVATLPTIPLPSRMFQILLQTLMLSLVLGVGLAFVLEYIDYTVKTPEVLDAIYDIPVQGVIGVLTAKLGKERNGSHLVTVSDPRSPLAESIRSLRTSMQVAGLMGPMHSLLITSSGPGEGKTFVAMNLAVSMAQSGSRVLLVDTDLRKPSLHYVFDLPREPGFTNLVVDQQANPADFLQPTNVENLWVLTCGTIPPNPAELLGSPRAAAVMEQLDQHADIVIFDSPPAATVTDAVVMAPRVDAVLQVELAGKTRIDLVRRCKSVLERSGAHILGPVLNRVSQPDLGYYAYYYSYGYYHNGHNGYNPGEPAKPRGLFRHSQKKKAAVK
jgi:capsular exopolysaccharide synthesis family protein